MKILYVITGLGLGGAEKVVVDLANQMYELGHHIRIVYLTGEIAVRPKYAQIELHGLNLNHLTDLYRSSQAYRTIIKAFRPDIVHAHMIHANIFTRLNRIGCEIPRLICTAHSSNEGGHLRMMAYRLTNFLSDINTNVSQQAVDRLIELGAFQPKNTIAVYNGIDTNRYSPQLGNKEIKRSELRAKPEQRFIFAAGRFNVLKDYPNLLHAIHVLLKNYFYQDFHIFIAGDGELRPQIEEIIDTLNLNTYVTLLGRRDDIAELMSVADVFTLASSHEGFSLVVAEAMACETYVVATDCGGVAEVMGGTGSLVPIQNSYAFAQALYNALNMPIVDLEVNNRAARLRVIENFSLNRAVQQWLDLYETK